MDRIFVYDGREFPDPDPRLSVEDIRKQLADFFPELTNADTREVQRGEDRIYTFSRRIGTKGARRRRQSVVAVLRGVPETCLRVFDLAAELIDPDGELDIDRAGARQPEINLAIAEAGAYAHATRQAVEALRRSAPR